MTNVNYQQDQGPSPIMTDRTYNFLRWVSQYWLPAAGTLYFALASIWNLPFGEEVVGSISAITIFVGVVIGIGNRSYKASGAGIDGALIIDDSDPDKDVYQLNLETPIDDVLKGKQTITFKVDASALSARRGYTPYNE